MRSSYSYTKAACYLGYVTQAIVNNFAPMLFVLFRAELGLSYVQVTSLVTLNFGIQLLVDLLSSFVIERIGYRPCIAAAHIFCALGLSCMAVLPFVLPAYAGLLLSVCIYSVGGGLIEVLISPIIEACPAQNKAAQMTFLHSFYCWGTAAVVSVTTLVFALFGTGRGGMPRSAGRRCPSSILRCSASCPSPRWRRRGRAACARASCCARGRSGSLRSSSLPRGRRNLP